MGSSQPYKTNLQLQDAVISMIHTIQQRGIATDGKMTSKGDKHNDLINK